MKKIKLNKNNVLYFLSIITVGLLTSCSGGGGASSQSSAANNEAQVQFNPSSYVTNAQENGGNTRTKSGILVGFSQSSTSGIPISQNCSIDPNSNLQTFGIRMESKDGSTELLSFYDNQTGSPLPKDSYPQIMPTSASCGDNPIYCDVNIKYYCYILITHSAFVNIPLSDPQNTARSVILNQYSILEKNLQQEEQNSSSLN